MKKYTFSKVYSLFKKFGGIRLFFAYARLGLLSRVFIEVVKGVCARQSADKIYYRYQKDIVKALRAKYHDLMVERLREYESRNLDHKKSEIIWWCWFQGLESAPPIVKACYRSLQQHIKNKEIRVIDETNRKEYVQFPDYIERRWKKRQITPEKFANLIRLELLIKYGGTWIDATVLCSGDHYPPEYLNADLFFFQYMRKDTNRFSGISSWFISSYSNNPVLMTLRDMHYAYWKDFDCVLEYFIFHRFIEMIFHIRPEIVYAMPYGYSPDCQILLNHWSEQFDQRKWDQLTERVSFHKVSYKNLGNIPNDKGNYYNHILKEYS